MQFAAYSSESVKLN